MGFTVLLSHLASNLYKVYIFIESYIDLCVNVVECAYIVLATLTFQFFKKSKLDRRLSDFQKIYIQIQVK